MFGDELVQVERAGLSNGKLFALGRFRIRGYVQLRFGVGHAGLPCMGDRLRPARCRFPGDSMSVGGARNSRSHTSYAKLVCEDALNAGVSARAAAFMPAPDHSPGARFQEIPALRASRPSA